MFESIPIMLEMGKKQISGLLQENIISHLTVLADKFKYYFPEVSGKEMNLVRNSFSCSVDSTPDELQDELINLQHDSTAKYLLDDSTVKEFWIHMINSYSNVAKVALRLLLPFASRYLCKSGISTMLFIKTAHRNRLELEDDIRCALSETSPHMEKKKQCQTSLRT